MLLQFRLAAGYSKLLADQVGKRHSLNEAAVF